MAKVAKAPAKKTSPVVYLGVLAAVVAAYLVLSPAAPPPSANSAAKPKSKSAKDASGFTKDDYAALKNPFPTAAVAAVDAFNPVVKKTVLPKIASLPPEPGSATQIPATLTGGEANWYFTGCPSTDGVRTALFENTSTGESVFVKSGQAFKAARVQSVDVSTVVLTGPNGDAATIPIVGFGEVPGAGSKTTVAANGPLPVPTGAIGGPLPAAVGRPLAGAPTATLPNGQTVQLPANLAPGAGNDLNVAPDTNAAPSGRRRRRNRNQNLGDPNNGQ